MTNQTKPEIRIIESWTGGYTVEIGRKTHPGQEAPWVPEARFEGYTLEAAEAAGEGVTDFVRHAIETRSRGGAKGRRRQ